MKSSLNWNHERWRTRDLLLTYDETIMPSMPQTAGLSMVYPWEKTPMEFLGQQLYSLVRENGYTESKEQFLQDFTESVIGRKQIIYDSYINFPQTGDINILYFDLDNKILYYWDNDYIPVNAMLIANTILEGGDA